MEASITRSPAFTNLDRAQRQVNAFFWSSEFAYELVRQKVLTGEVHRRNPNRVDIVFKDVTCNAFVPPSKALRSLATGETPKYTTKYNATTRVFETHLRNNLEQICRYVIVRFYSALERYLKARASPFLGLVGPPRMDKRKIKRFQDTEFHRMEKYLRDKNVPFRCSVPSDKAVIAQAFRMLRNQFIHKEAKWRPPWNDADYRKRLDCFKLSDRKLILRRVCDGAKHLADEQVDEPLLFFYTLFSLTGFRNFAEAMEDALPL